MTIERRPSAPVRAPDPSELPVRIEGPLPRSHPVREAFVLPLLLLTVGLLGSIRVGPGGQLSFVGPTLLALVLSVVLMGLLVRSGLVSPDAFVGPVRGAFENANGLVILIALLFACAQVFTMLTPDRGLFELIFDAFFVGMLWTTAAAGPDGPRLMRSLAVVFGWALVLRFVFLNEFAAPDGSVARRLFAAALEGLTLGALGVTYYAPATGYIAFVMLGCLFVALFMLPSSAGAYSTTKQRQ
jgi:hypothetical protein